MIALPKKLDEYYKKRIIALTHGEKLRNKKNDFVAKFDSEFEALAHDILRVAIVHYPEEPDLTLDAAYQYMFKITDTWEPIYEADLFKVNYLELMIIKIKTFFIGFKKKKEVLINES